MSDIATLRALLERVEEATGSDRELDRDLGKALGWENDHGVIICAGYIGTGSFTSSVDASVRLIQEVLPGWWWKTGTCCVSDDACVAPDFNSPVHGARLKAQFPNLVAGSEFDVGFDVDRRPPGNVPLALLEAALRALVAVREMGT